MKKRFWKRILSAFTAVTMTASTFAAFSLPARAAEESAGFKASVAAQLRASDTAFETINAVSTKFVTDSADIEMTRKSEVYFGAFYQFAPIAVPDGKAVKSVIMTINRGANFTGEYYDVYKVDNPSDNTDISQVFALAAPALAGTSGNYIGKTADGTAPEGTDYGTITVDITDGFNADTANSYFIQRDENDTNKKPIRADAAITVEYSDIVSSGSAVTASTAAQLRASDDEWSTINSGSSKFVTGTENIETTVTNRFGAFYNFNRIPLPSGAKVTKATLSVYQGATKFSGKHFVVLHTDNPLELTNINSVFAIVKPAKDSISTIRVGGASAVTAMKELKDADSNRIEYIDITEYFNSDSRNSYFLYNSDSADAGNRQLSARAEIELEYVLPVAQIEDIYYYSFSDALSAASDGDTITLLANISTSGFTNINKSVTIEGGGNTLTQSNGQWDYAEVANGKTVTINNLTITGNKLNVPQTSVINAAGCNISALNLGGNGGTSKGTLTNSTIGTLSTYGKVNLVNTKITDVEFIGINSASDTPEISGDATSSITGTVSFGGGVATANITFPYTLFSGEMSKPAVTLTGTVFASGYSYSDGVISAKTALTSVALDKKTGIKTGDTLSAAVLPEGASVDYTWERSTDGENWSSISGETTYSYTLTSDDYDNYIKVTATGKDSYGGTVSDLTTDKVSKIQDTYTVTFKDGDGNTLDTVTVNNGGAAPAYSGATPTKTSTDGYSYTFNNTWTPALEGTITSNTTFTANFDQTARTYTITYNMQGHGTAPADTSHTYGSAKTLPTPAAEGYTFDGWYKTYNSETETYSDKVESITSTDYGNLVLYAKWTEIPPVQKHDITLENGLEGKLQVDAEASEGSTVTVKITDNSFVKGSLLAVYTGNVIQAAGSGDTYTFTMPSADVTLSALFDGEKTTTIVASDDYCYNVQAKSVNRGHYIRNQSDADEKNLALGFDVGDLDLSDKTVKLQIVKTGYSAYTATVVNLINGDPWETDSFNYELASGSSINVVADGGENGSNGQYYKCTYTLDSSKLTKVGNKLYFNIERAEQAQNQSGNDYFAIPSAQVDNGKKASKAEYLPKLIITGPKEPAPEKKAPAYALQTDTLNNTFQYHFAGGTTAYNNGEDETGKAYDVYLWVPNNVAPGELKGLVAIKMNLVEVPFAYSQHLRDALAGKGFGILFLVCQKDPYKYNNTLNGFYTRNDYKGDPITYTDSYKATYTTDGKDAADIMNELLAGIAEASDYSEIKDTVPLITIGHSAASGFGNKSANWDKDRVIAQIHMKNGMGGGEAMIPGVPQLQYAAQYTEHAMGAGRDRSVDDARYHITNKRAVNSEYLVSHIIEWGSGHYDWSENATYMLTKYITKAIDARLPANYAETGVLNDLTGTGYIMKPFEKDENGEEQAAGYYRDYLQGWLSDGKANSTTSETDKKASFWFFDEEFAKEVNEFANYAIPESPSSNLTGISGKTYSDIEPFMLMKDPSKSTYATTPDTANTVIKPYTTFASNPFSRYGSVRFINYTKLAAPNGNSSNTANLQGYGTVTVDTYYMNKIPSITAGSGNAVAYDGAGKSAYVPENTKAEFLPLIAPYEFVSSDNIDISGMTKSGDESENVASVTRTTLRFHNDRVYFRSGNAETLKQQYPNHTINTDFGTMDMFGVIKSPEIRGADGFVTSTFKVTSAQMNVPYVATGNNRTTQTLTLENIEDVNVNGVTENPKFAVTYTSNDEDLQKFTDVMVEYGPARAVRSGNDTDGYTWKIEILRDQIPKNATYPIEVNVVASNLGKWEKISGATASKTFNIVSEEVQPTSAPTAAPTVTPTASPEETAAPTVTPTASPEETAAPTVTPTASPEATTAPTATPTEAPQYTFDTDFTPAQIKGINEYDEETPLNGWFSNDTEDNVEAINSVKTGEGQLVMTNGDDEANLWIGKNYATQEEAEEAAKIILKFRYTPGSTDSRIYLASASAADVTAGLDSDTVEGTYKTASELGMKADKTYDVVVTIDNSKNEAVFTVTENAEISPMSVTLMAYVDLTAEVPDDTNTVIFRPAAGATDKLDYFSAELLSEVKPTLKIGEITQSADKTTVTVSVENPTDKTDAGVMIAALYGADHALKQIQEVNGNIVDFDKATDGYVKLFLWTALSGDNAMQPILPSKEKAISTN